MVVHVMNLVAYPLVPVEIEVHFIGNFHVLSAMLLADYC